ncbi:hypothetical protein D3C85_1862650 [compost metagenome]
MDNHCLMNMSSKSSIIQVKGMKGGVEMDPYDKHTPKSEISSSKRRDLSKSDYV